MTHLGVSVRGGYTKHWRCEMDSWIWQLPPAHYKVASWVRLSVNIEDKVWVSNGQRIPIKRGQILTSLTKISEGANVTRDQARAAIRNLEAGGFLTTVRTRNGTRPGTLITVVNFDYWQSSEGEAARREHTKAHATGYAGTHTETHTSTPLLKKEEERILAAPKKARPKKRQPSGDHQEFIAHFDALFQKHHGSKPTWNGKTGKQVKELLKSQPLDELKRRATNMFEDPPGWLEPPYTLSTLQANLDRFAASKPQAPAVDPELERISKAMREQLAREAEEDARAAAAIANGEIEWEGWQ